MLLGCAGGAVPATMTIIGFSITSALVFVWLILIQIAINSKCISAHKTKISCGLSCFVSPSSTNNDVEDGICLGFLGCGKITSSIVTGLASAAARNNDNNGNIKIKSITVTSRSKEKSTLLKESFPDLVNVVGDGIINEVNHLQQIVQDSDILFLCVLPEQVQTVLSQVTLDPQRHSLISLVSTCKVDTLVELSRLPRDRVVKMIYAAYLECVGCSSESLPNVSRCEGLCLVTPPIFSGSSSSANTAIIKELFETLGGYIECQNESIMQTMMVITGLMGPMYGILKANADWLVEHGVPPDDATYFVGQTYKSIIQDASSTNNNNNEAIISPSLFDDLIKEQTPGGLNEQALKNLNQLGLTKSYRAAMDVMLSRLEGSSDGWINLPDKK